MPTSTQGLLLLLVHKPLNKARREEETDKGNRKTRKEETDEGGRREGEEGRKERKE